MIRPTYLYAHIVNAPGYGWGRLTRQPERVQAMADRLPVAVSRGGGGGEMTPEEYAAAPTLRIGWGRALRGGGGGGRSLPRLRVVP